jgi:hypothetical protein
MKRCGYVAVQELAAGVLEPGLADAVAPRLRGEACRVEEPVVNQDVGPAEAAYRAPRRDVDVVPVRGVVQGYEDGYRALARLQRLQYVAVVIHSLKGEAEDPGWDVDRPDSCRPG